MSKVNKSVNLTALSAVAEGPTGANGGNVLNGGKYWVTVFEITSKVRWGEVPVAGSIPADFVNHFNADIRGTGSGDTLGVVGYLDGISIGVNLDNLYFDSTESPVGANNIYGKIKPVNPWQNNIIGWTNPDATPFGRTEGYYGGEVDPHDFDPNRIVVIIVDNDVHLIQVTDQGVVSNTTFVPPIYDPGMLYRSAISYNYKSLLAVTFTSLDEVFSTELSAEEKLLKARLEKHLKGKK